VALLSRGGYGLTRLLPGIQYKQLAKTIDKGMQWVGFSDFTALQCALLAKTGRTTWAGPNLCEGFGPKAGPMTSWKPALTTCCAARARAPAGASCRCPPCRRPHPKRAVPRA